MRPIAAIMADTSETREMTARDLVRLVPERSASSSSSSSSWVRLLVVGGLLVLLLGG